MEKRVATSSISKNTSKTICPLPFLHTYIEANGSIVACCEAQDTMLGKENEPLETIWNNSNYKTLRAQLSSGEKPELCTKCWRNEDLGVKSNREEAWEYYDYLFGEDTEIHCNSDFSVDRLPIAIEVKCSNLCNLKCKMCHPKSSNRIIEDREIIDKYRPKMPWSDGVLSAENKINELIQSDDNFFDNLRLVQFSGGEPLLSDAQFDFLKKLLEYSPDKYQIRYATNLTQINYRGIDYIELWRKFKSVNIKVSIDGINEVYDFIRSGSSYEKVHRNITKLLKTKPENVNLSLGLTTQAYNVFQLPDFFDKYENIVGPENITYHLLSVPKFLRASVYPDEIKNLIIDKLAASGDRFIKTINALKKDNFDEKLWNQFLGYTKDFEKKYPGEVKFTNILKNNLGVEI